ncbi:MAG: KEOPS complex N(6)-L-threonylcarbamoyladenine synthase Kae1 [Candidatus Bathyarchaeia archaeon]
MTEDRLVCLGVESTAHTFGVALADEAGTILSDARSVYVPAPGRGIHPREAAEHHGRCAPKVLREALDQAGLKMDQVDLVAYSRGPGLGPPLRVGATLARGLAAYYDKPLIPVHHAIGHIEIGSLTTGARDPLVILVSGGHTALAAFAGERWRIFGETEDITLGNLLDMFAREVGLPPPGGSSVEEAATKGGKLIDLPYTVKGNDVVYSGLLTAAIQKHREGEKLSDLCFSLQEVAFAMLTEASERCLAHIGKEELLLTGGVAANRRLQEMLRSIAEEHKAKFHVVDGKYASDSGAQIAWTGILAYKAGLTIPIEESFIRSKWRLDEVDIPWR